MLHVQMVIFVVAHLAPFSVLAQQPRRHSPWGLVAWTLLLVLILFYPAHWFRDPFSACQMASWGLLAISGYLGIESIHLIRKVGRPRDDSQHTAVLVVQGAYKYIRHPLYASLLLFAWAVF